MSDKKARLILFLPINTMSKLFCSCPNSEAARSSSCPICRELPGTMPLINKHALNIIIAAGCIMKSRFNASCFERKPFFNDGRLIQYTITQENSPMCTDGYFLFGQKEIKINKIYLEQESGLLDGKIDYNKRGRPRLCIETAPSFINSSEAYEFYEHLRARLDKRELLKEGRTHTCTLRFAGGAEISGIETVQLEKAFEWGESAKRAAYIWKGSEGEKTPVLPGKVFYPNVNLCNIHVDPEWIRRVRMQFGV